MEKQLDSKTEMNKSMSESVKVIVRCRPMSDKETSCGYQNILGLHPEVGGVEIRNPKSSSKKYFNFDAVYNSGLPRKKWKRHGKSYYLHDIAALGAQADLYDEVFRPLVDSVISGFNGTIFAYGQTGAGKTYTMEGIVGDRTHEGIIPSSFRHIFSHIARTENTQFLVSASYLEIYQEEVRDLLSPDPHRKLEVRERNDTGVYVKDLTVTVCKTADDLQKVMVDGKQNRSIGKTNMNVHSSRSHAIFMISIESCENETDGSQHVKIGKLNLVDLAGSERQSKTGAKGLTCKESIKINLSLSALGNVISALVDGKSIHVPYRDSKLTRLLQDSLGGNAKTIMIANVGPASYNYEETLTTLRYANRAKNIRNKPVINVDPKDAILLQYQQEITRLKAQLALKEAKRKKKKQAKILESDVIEETDDNNEQIVQKLENLISEERVAYLNQQNLLAEVKEKILRDIKEKDEELRLENEAKEKLKTQLQELEGKLLCGGKNIIDHTNEQQRVLEKRRQQLAEQKCIEREMQKQLVDEEENTLMKKETYDSLQQEVEIKTKKLKKLFQRLQAVKEDINDEQEINSYERQEKEQTIEELTRQLKLSNLVIDNFVNPEDKAKFLEQVQYDEDEDTWIYYTHKTHSPLQRPVSAHTFRREKSSHALYCAKVASRASHIHRHVRYMSDNITSSDLVIPRRRTVDHYEPEIDPYVREAVKNILAGQVLNCSEVLRKNSAAYESSRSPDSIRRQHRRLSTRSGALTHSVRALRIRDDTEQYPVPRGLVPK